MSSAISTDKGALKPDSTDTRTAGGLEPWQFFVLAALGCATAVTFIARGQGPTAIILLALLMAAAALVGYATLRTVRPLVSADEERAAVVGQRTRVAIEREKLLTLRSIKELEFDRAMGRLSDDDFAEMSARLRQRAAGLMRQLDAGASFRDQVERDLAKRLGGAGAAAPPASARVGDPVCAACNTVNDLDARYCKRCGAPVVAPPDTVTASRDKVTAPRDKVTAPRDKVTEVDRGHRAQRD